jgi:transposase-like protein
MRNSNEVVHPYQQSFHVVKDVYGQIREMVECQLRGSVLALVQELFTEEVKGLCGPTFSRKGDQFYHRGGSDPGSVLLQGQRVAVKKLRVKKDGQDVELKSYTALQHFDLLCDKVMRHMLSGVSTRDYGGLLDEIQGGLGLSKSSVSRAFVRGSKERLEEINGRDLSKYEFIAIMIDGIEFGDRTVIAAMGITKSKANNPNDAGEKIVLGLREGDTENWEVCKDLLQSIVDRGVDPTLAYLFVLDGSKALKKAVRKVFGEKSRVQRCVRHKERNILRYLSHGNQMEFCRLWKRLHGMADITEAKREYERLRQWLGQRNHAALTSLDEAEMETLTVIELKLPALLRKTLLSTNPLESMFSIVDTKKDRVKNWKRGEKNNQVARWAAATLSEAEQRVNRIKGHRELILLESELRKSSVENEMRVA